jgi:ABC-type uncharacterized transport system fused permease/ATPase subunit
MNTFISGANGCGKTSLFRILGGLWPLKGGVLTRPSKNDIFYIPQKAYLPKGTLRDQIIYPMTHDEFIRNGGKDEELEKLMEMVTASKVLKRQPNGLNTVRVWQDILSGGEKQRVAMARLYFHKPKFAILDECTSAVSVDVEDTLYSQAKELGITLITTSHRVSVMKFHEYILTFKDNKTVTFGKLQ